MPLRRPVLLFLLLIAGLIIGSSQAAAQRSARSQAQASTYTLYMPIIGGTPPGTQPFGFDMRLWYVNEQTLKLASEARPRWVRLADVLWSDVEPQPGQYRWEKLLAIEQSAQRFRAAGIEPVVVVTRAPSWARQMPSRLCSPPARQHLGSLTRFLELLSARYKSGPSAIYYWEFWNEPDRGPENLDDNVGSGCWGTQDRIYRGGDYYGEVLKYATAAIKRGNPYASVIGGSLIYWLDSNYTERFLEGMLVSGGVAAVDVLSFHAYGEWEASDWLVTKTNRIRAQLKPYGLLAKPLMATEVAATCSPSVQSNCNTTFISYNQANYAARIYAEAMALGLFGAFWYTLAEQSPGFDQSHLIDVASNGTQAAPRPAYNAFRNSALLLQGGRYIGLPITDPTLDKADKVQTLVFQKGNGITMYVMWVQRLPGPDDRVIYNLPVPKGALARCTTNLDGRNIDGSNDGKPYHFNCSDRNNDSSIPFAISMLPQYVEVQAPTATSSEFASSIQGLPEQP